MARPRGTPSPDFEEKRTALLNRLLAALVKPGESPSLRGLARAADVTVPTLRHYFGDRDDVLAAVFSHCRQDGAKELKTAATPSGPVDESIRDLLRHAAGGIRYAGVGRLNELGLREGLSGSAAASAYLADVLDPTLDAFSERIAVHVAAGELRELDPRIAALQLLSPLLMTFLHQSSLGGADRSPVDFDRLIEETAAVFVRGNQPDA